MMETDERDLHSDKEGDKNDKYQLKGFSNALTPAYRSPEYSPH
jgi:hypothetical protein